MTTDLDALYDSEQWMIRMDHDGVSFGEFRWAPIGEWTAAPDWTAEAECEGGLFGQGPGDGEHSYCKPGTRLVLCETRGPRIRVDGNKIKVPAARIVAVDGMIPARFFGHVSLDLDRYPHPLPALTQVGGYLHLGSYPHPLPALTQVGGDLFLGSYPHPLPALTQVGGDLHLGSYPHALPCPFCGSKPHCEQWHPGSSASIWCAASRCPAVPIVHGRTPRIALQRWNKRAT